MNCHQGHRAPRASGEELEKYRARIAEFRARFAERERYAFQRLGRGPKKGRLRVRCPAAIGQVRCPLKPASLRASLSRPLAMEVPMEPLAIACRQSTMTVPESESTLYQRDRWGTPAWEKSYSRRTRVEGYFGNLKGSATEYLQRGAFRVFGLAKVSLMLLAFVVATNLRLVRRWRQRTARPSPPPSTSPQHPVEAAVVNSVAPDPNKRTADP